MSKTSLKKDQEKLSKTPLKVTIKKYLKQLGHLDSRLQKQGSIKPLKNTAVALVTSDYVPYSFVKRCVLRALRKVPSLSNSRRRFGKEFHKVAATFPNCLSP